MNFPKNVFGEPLKACCFQPLTGFYRDGYCRTDARDGGRHVVCAVMTDDFLAFTRRRGNDLSTPMPAYGFPGLRAGDRWCLCALRWKEALNHQVAPPVLLEACAEEALAYVELSDLIQHAALSA